MSDVSGGTRTIHTNGISLRCLEQGGGPLLVLCHGFPETAHSWRHQIPTLARAGYHVLAPNQRGYDGSERPPRVEDYDIVHLTDDLLGLLDDAGEDQAVFVGHDWGAIVVWQMAVLHPDRVRGVVGMSVPFIPRPPAPPTQLLAAISGDRFDYILYFQQPGVADEELGRDPRETLSRVLWSASGDAPKGSIKRLPAEGTGWLDILSPMPDRLPSWLTDDDLDAYAGAFQRSGFTGPLNWYRNFDRNWELLEPYAGAKVEVPSLFVAGERDAVLKLTPPQVMDGWATDLRGSVLIEGAGHWVQQERPEEVNRALLAFLGGLGPTEKGP